MKSIYILQSLLLLGSRRLDKGEGREADSLEGGGMQTIVRGRRGDNRKSLEKMQERRGKGKKLEAEGRRGEGRRGEERERGGRGGRGKGRTMMELESNLSSSREEKLKISKISFKRGSISRRSLKHLTSMPPESPCPLENALANCFSSTPFNFSSPSSISFLFSFSSSVNKILLSGRRRKGANWNRRTKYEKRTERREILKKWEMRECGQKRRGSKEEEGK